MSELVITAFATLFVAIGPIDTAIVFGGLTAGVHRPERFRLAWQAVMVAGVVLLGFALFGNQVLAALRVSLDAFRVAGGILLLLQAIQMIFAHLTGLSSLTDLERRDAIGSWRHRNFPTGISGYRRTGWPDGCRPADGPSRRRSTRFDDCAWSDVTVSLSHLSVHDIHRCLAPSAQSNRLKRRCPACRRSFGCFGCSIHFRWYSRRSAPRFSSPSDGAQVHWITGELVGTVHN